VLRLDREPRVSVLDLAPRTPRQERTTYSNHAAPKASNRGYETCLQPRRLVGTRLGGFVGYLVDLSFLGRRIGLRVGQANVLPEALFCVGITNRNEGAVVKAEAERIDVPYEEAVLTLVDLVECLALSALMAATVFSSIALASAAVPCAKAAVENKTAAEPSTLVKNLRNIMFLAELFVRGTLLLGVSQRPDALVQAKTHSLCGR
jgi:hypothetical protein